MTTEQTYFKEWMKVLDRGELNKVTSILDLQYKRIPISPSKENVFRAFRLCPYDNLKIVMIGQDPYPQKGVATGILFGNRSGVPEKDISPSLRVVKEAVIDPEIPHGHVIFDNTMENWAKQGILMINSALTVEINRIGSHTMLWRGFISKMLKNLSEINPGLIYVLFGGQAQTFSPYINESNKVFYLKHPAYYARTGQRLKTTLFNDINLYLKQKNNTQIKWYEEVF